MKRFLFAGEGLTDYIVIKNLLIGFFKDKNLAVSRLFPRDKITPGGWGNVLNYLSTDEFREGVNNTDYIVIQIDTDKCEEWNEGLHHIGDNSDNLEDFVRGVITVLIKRTGQDFYTQNKDKFLFAISIHDIQCWLLPFIADQPAHQSKIVGCVNAVERIAVKQGISINQKNYEDGKHYEKLSQDMKKNNTLMQRYSLNPSLKIFIDILKTAFPSGQSPVPEVQEPEQL
jgi:hypothetical protein